MSLEAECHAMLDAAGVAIGNEHGKYSLQERLHWLICANELGWRRYDELHKAAMGVTTDQTLRHLVGKTGS